MKGWSKHKLRRWIPVTERLPQMAGKYLVWIPSITGRGYIDILYYGEPAFPNHRRERCFYESDSEWGDVFYDDVIAWMELPEPFNGEVEENG